MSPAAARAGGAAGAPPPVTLFEIERFALHDGPGIRTLVFFKGCPLRCAWCSNPESQAGEPQPFYRARRCLGCRRCREACPQGAISFGGPPDDAPAGDRSGRDGRVVQAPSSAPAAEAGASEAPLPPAPSSAPGPLRIDRGRCRGCGACADACNTTALSLVGRRWTPAEALAEIRRDEPFYRHSGGGVTFSGGEPAMQPQALAELARLCRAAGIHTAVETCGHYPWEALEGALPYLDLVLYDLKHMDPGRHEALTGVSNERILANFERLLSRRPAGQPGGRQPGGDAAEPQAPSPAPGAFDLRVRLPLIPGLNDGEENLRRLREYLQRAAPGVPVDLLPYHRLGGSKYGSLDRPYGLEALLPPPEEELKRIRAFLEEAGIPARIER